MRNLHKSIVFIMLLFAFLISSAFADVVYLKNGKIIRGKITEKTDNTVTIETEDEWFRIELKDVEKIVIEKEEPIIEIISSGKKDDHKEKTKQVKRKMHFGCKGGWVNHRATLEEESDSEGGWGFGAWFAYPLAQVISMRGQIGYNGFSVEETEDISGYDLTVKGSLRDWSIISYVLFHPSLGGDLYANFGGGLGIHIMGISAKITDEYGYSISDSESSTNLGFDFLGGLSFPTGNTSLLVEVGYNIVLVPSDWYDSYNELTIMGGVEF